MIELHNRDSLDVTRAMEINSIDLVVTSPPYDDLRAYPRNQEMISLLIPLLHKKLKLGGVVVWVIADQTKNGTESGTSFDHARQFMEAGFNLHDTMIYLKNSWVPLTHNRYEQAFEYMFVFSKGKPKTFNPIRVKCFTEINKRYAESATFYESDNRLRKINKVQGNEDKISGNVWTYKPGSFVRGGIGHPAVFPLQLALDHIVSWSNEGDLVYDPFMGSGTTGIAAKQLNRSFIGVDIEEKYVEIARQRIEREV